MQPSLSVLRLCVCSLSLLLLLGLVGRGQAQGGIDLSQPLTYSSASLGDICHWTGFPPQEVREEFDVAGGRMRQWYERLPRYKDLSCVEYYGIIRARYLASKTQHWRDMLIWQCWYDDPCACEQDRS